MTRRMLPGWLLVLMMGFSPAPSFAWDRVAKPFGLGLEFGDPTGLSAKYYLGPRYALEGGLGFFGWPWGSGGHLDMLYEFPNAVHTNQSEFTLPLFLGAGFKGGGYVFCAAKKSGVCDVGEFAGVRVPFGASMQFQREPLELQLEIAPAFYAPFSYRWGAEVDLSFAARLYF